METVGSLAELKSIQSHWGSSKVAFVPTMGALHDGHLALVRQAKALADKVVVSIFVNPIQFGPKEDFAKYPRTVEADSQLLRSVGADALFLPTAAMMYPEGFQTYVYNKDMANILCGARRVGHFEGVLTVVAMLLNMAAPSVAIFGKKDYQQWRLIETMVRDLHLPYTVLGANTVREADGLAMSSRNRYLDAGARDQARFIYRGLVAADQAYGRGTRDVAALLAHFKNCVAAVPQLEIEYVEVLTQKDLKPPKPGMPEPAVIIAACHLAGVRLIDNLELGQPA